MVQRGEELQSRNEKLEREVGELEERLERQRFTSLSMVNALQQEHISILRGKLHGAVDGSHSPATASRLHAPGSFATDAPSRVDNASSVIDAVAAAGQRGPPSSDGGGRFFRGAAQTADIAVMEQAGTATRVRFDVEQPSPAHTLSAENAGSVGTTRAEPNLVDRRERRTPDDLDVEAATRPSWYHPGAAAHSGAASHTDAWNGSVRSDEAERSLLGGRKPPRLKLSTSPRIRPSPRGIEQRAGRDMAESLAHGFNGVSDAASAGNSPSRGIPGSAATRLSAALPPARGRSVATRLQRTGPLSNETSPDLRRAEQQLVALQRRCDVADSGVTRERERVLASPPRGFRAVSSTEEGRSAGARAVQRPRRSPGESAPAVDARLRTLRHRVKSSKARVDELGDSDVSSTEELLTRGIPATRSSRR